MSIVVKNPRSGIEAVAYGENLSISGSGGWNDLCDHFVGVCYGWSHTGQYSAWNHYLAIPAGYRLANSAQPPLGALGFFKGGQGHVCIADGNGTWISTDQPWPKNKGKVGTKITTKQIEDTFGLPYVGATMPYFPHGVGPVLPVNQIWTGDANIVHVNHVQPGMHNDEVELLQEALRNVNLYFRAISGVFDAATVSAYSAWQHRCGYTGSDADGKPGIKSLTTLGNTTHLFKASLT